MDPLKLVSPFLNVIKSGDTTGLVTSIALNSLTNFVIYKIIDPHHPDVQSAINEITFSVTRTKFEATDVVSDEIVFSTILKFLRTIVTSEVGRKCITEKGMCEIIEVAFGMHFQTRISKLLRKDAEDTLIIITSCMFERLVGSLGDGNIDDSKLLNTKSFVESNNRMGITAIIELFRVIVGLLDPKDPKHTDTLHRTIALKLSLKALEVGGKSLAKLVCVGLKLDVERRATNIDEDEDEKETYIPAETKATVVSIGANGASYAPSNPHSATEEETPLLEPGKLEAVHRQQSTRSLMDLAKESDTPKDFEHSIIQLKNLIVDDLCKQLFRMLSFQNITFNMPPTIVSTTIVGLICRCISTVMNTMKACLVPQRKFILEYLMDRCKDGVHTWDIEDRLLATESETALQPLSSKQKTPNTPTLDFVVPPIREIFLSTILAILSDDTTISDLYIYHDAFLYCKSKVLDSSLKFLVTFTYPDIRPGEPVTDISHQSMSFDGIIQFLSILVNRRFKSTLVPTMKIKGEVIELTTTSVQDKLKRKEVYNEGVVKFNENVKLGIKHFQENGFLPEPLTPEAMAQFLHISQNLDKTQVGEYIGKPVNGACLKAFVNFFDFKSKRIDQALRMLLEKFRIPGEAQVIDRIIDAFSIKYFATLKPEESEIATLDATTILAFSIIMLNTDLHSVVVRKRMSFEEYQRNLRGVNNKQNFSADLLGHIYDAIKVNPFILAEDHGGDLGFEHQWKDILKTTEFCPALTEHTETDSNLFDKQLFRSNWKPILNSIIYVLQNIDDATFFKKGLIAMQYFAILAAHFGEFEIVDKIISSLFSHCGLSELKSELPIEIDILADTSEVDSAKSLRKKPSRWITDIGQSYRSQILAVLGFNLTIDFFEHLNNSWEVVVKVLGNLFLHQILPKELLVCDHFSRDKVMIPRLLLKNEKKSNEQSPKRDGLLKSFANFLSISSTEDDDFDNLEKYEKAAKECINMCGITGLINESKYIIK